MQGPLIPPPSEPKIVNWQSARVVTALKRHFKAHYRRWGGGAAVVAAVAILVVAVAIKESRSNGAIQLQASDKSGQLQISWDPNAGPIRRAVGAKLYIVDGSDRLYVTLDTARLRRGAVSYARRNDRVELRLALAEPDGKSVEGQATFVGTRPDEFQLETKAPAVAVPEPPYSPAPAAARPAPPHEIAVNVPVSGQRARKKPLGQSGTSLPFTCSAGDTFRKTDAPAGWDTFTCRGNNVWSLVPAQTREGRSVRTPSPSATTLTAEPATASTI